MQGVSVAGAFREKTSVDNTAAVRDSFSVDRVVYNEHNWGRYIRMGDWKLVSLTSDTTWQLYDLAHDGSELVNLAARYPDTVRKMDRLWQVWARQNKVLPRP